jgi:hypothetical protein
LKASLGDGLHGVFLGGVGLERNDIELHGYSSSGLLGCKIQGQVTVPSDDVKLLVIKIPVGLHVKQQVLLGSLHPEVSAGHLHFHEDFLAFLDRFNQVHVHISILYPFIGLGRELIHQRRSLASHTIRDSTSHQISKQLHLLLIKLEINRKKAYKGLQVASLICITIPFQHVTQTPQLGVQVSVHLHHRVDIATHLFSPQNTKIRKKTTVRKIIASKINSRTVCKVFTFIFSLLLIINLSVREEISQVLIGHH